MATKDKVIAAARRVLDQKIETYKAKNGREVSLQGDDGEKVWFVHSDPMFELQSALQKYDKRRAKLKATVVLGG